MSAGQTTEGRQEQGQTLRALHIFSGNLYGGVERSLLTLYLCRSECPEMTLHFGYCFEGRLSQELRDIGAPLFYLGSPRARWPLSIWRARRRLQSVLTEHHFDCVITNSPWAQAIFGPPIRRAGIRNVLRQHDLPEGKHWTERWAQLHPPDRVLCNSQFTLGVMQKLYSGVPADFLYPPVPNGCESFAAAARGATRRALDLSPEATVLIQIGRMEPVKGHSLMLKALSLLRDVPGWICLIVGGIQRDHEALYMQSLKDKARDWGISERVGFLGQRRDIFELLAASLGGAREILSGDYGVLVPTGDPQVLAEALRKLIEDPALRSKYRSSGPARADELCNPSQQTRRFYELLVQS